VGIGARYSFGVFLKSIATEFGMSRVATSSIFSMYMLLCVIMAILGGWAMDRYDPRKIGIFMGIFTGLSLLLTSQVYAPWQLLITYSLLLSLGTGPMYGVVNTTASRWFVKKRGFVVGITSAGGGVGAILIAPLATYLISNYSWRTAFSVLGIIAGVVIVVISLWLVKDPGKMGLFPDGLKPEKPLQVETENKNIITDFSLRQALRMNQFWLLGFSWLLLSLSLHMIFVHIVAYALDNSISAMDAAYILSLMGITNIFGRLVIGKLSDTWGRKMLGVISELILGGALVWLMWSQRLWMLYLFAIVFGFLWGGAGTTVTALIGDIFGMRRLGAIMGVITAGWAFGAAVGPALGGYIFDVSGNYFIAFGAGAVALFAGACCVGFIQPVNNNGHQAGRRL
jgi:MFS family permease